MLDKVEEPTLDELIGDYVKWRDQLKAIDAAFKERTAKARQRLKDQNVLILGKLQALKVDNVSTRTASPTGRPRSRLPWPTPRYFGNSSSTTSTTGRGT